ncbi:MAG TPA: tetratricopeptide repeat protein [Pyrinomonadaceae bacterium]|nr:tetratricopeptide repeat protein [Pyrinomonadaceae bacterium]
MLIQRFIITILCAMVLFTTAQGQNDFSTRVPPPISPETKLKLEKQLSGAQAHYESNPNSPDAIIWLGRRQAYLGLFTEAIKTFTDGIAKFPADARFYRHRGHRHITLRQFDRAIADLKKASELVKGKPDEIEPDGQPNERNIPTSTLQFNIWYHLGLAYFLTGQGQEALEAYRQCLKVSNSPDRLVATTHWLYMILRRFNRNSEAVKVLEPITEGMDVIENTSYYRLVLMYKGILPVERLREDAQGDSAASHSVLYGIGNWHLYNRRGAEASKIFRNILSSQQWTSFGYIAAEADLSRR